MANPQALLRHMIKVLRQVADVPLETLQRISEQIARQSGFLQDAELSALLADALEDEESQNAVFNVLQNLRPPIIDQVLETVEKWRRANSRNLEQFPDSLYEQLQERLPAIVRDYPSLDRMRKAEQLRTALGNELQGVMFICDARPVYDDDRGQIEGIIPITTMKIAYEQQDNSTREIEFVLTAEQLSNLSEHVKKAEQKLRILRERVSTWLPDGLVEFKE